MLQQSTATAGHRLQQYLITRQRRLPTATGLASSTSTGLEHRSLAGHAGASQRINNTSAASAVGCGPDSEQCLSLTTGLSANGCAPQVNSSSTPTRVSAPQNAVSPLLRHSSIFVKMQIFKTRANEGGAIWVAGGDCNEMEAVKGQCSSRKSGCESGNNFAVMLLKNNNKNIKY